EYGERLRPGEDATTVKVRGGKVLVTEGPFTEAKEWVGGFDIIDCRDLDEAIEIASKHPAARFSSAEVRPFMVWPDAEPGHRVVPHGFPEQPAKGKRYLMLVCVDPDAGLDGPDDVDPWVTEMDGRGVRLFGEVLRPPEDATQVMVRDGRVVVSDGPFSESKEWIAGIDFLEVRDLDEAIAVAAAHPMARTGLMVLTPAWPFDVEDNHVERAAREAAELGRRSEPAVAVAH
ncbi:MAG TPA: YciI family protein, partial [Propionicimonas sp.]|nr:YciI family protein [Propionicimonas sp.]